MNVGGIMINLAQLKIPNTLKAGDKIAAVSLSWGGAGDEGIYLRYLLARERLKSEFGLELIEMPNTLKGTEYVYAHPEKRAEDFMQAFLDPEIKGIFSCIGGDESIRMLPYIDFAVIEQHPKVFIGYSDTTVAHFMCLKAGLRSYYGPALLSEFAENVALHDYTIDSFQSVVMRSEVIGKIGHSNQWTSERLEWHVPENLTIKRRMMPEAHGVECLQGNGSVQGRLIGGCIEVIDGLRGTDIWPNASHFEGALLFLETSEETVEPIALERMLRALGAMSVFSKVSGILFGKPYDETHYEAYKGVIMKVISEELKLTELPILYNLNFGHTAPMLTLPIGALAELSCEERSFSILESGTK